MIRIPKLYLHRYVVLGLASASVFIIRCTTNNGLRAEQAISFMLGVWISDNQIKAECKMLDMRIVMALLFVSCLLLGVKQVPEIRALENSIEWQMLQIAMKVSATIAIIGLSYKFKIIFNNVIVWFIGGISYGNLPCSFSASKIANQWDIGNDRIYSINISGCLADKEII